MGKLIIDVFRKSPFSDGIMLFLTALHIVGIKNLRTPMEEVSEKIGLIFCFYIFVMFFWAIFILPKIEQPKKEKQTWKFIVLFIISETIIATFFIL